jgi:putative ABC transport system substrate-binding protein
VDRRRFLLTSLAGAVAAPLAVEALQAANVVRIGWLAPTSTADWAQARGAFVQGLRDRGYVESRLLIESRYAEGNSERLPALAAELVALKVDIIVTVGTNGAVAATKATRTTPIVFGAVGDPVTSGLVASLARPGGNVTGLSLLGSRELLGKNLDLLKETVPGVTRIALLQRSGILPERAGKDLREGADVAARALGVQLQLVEVRGPEDFDRAFSEMTRTRVGALAVYGPFAPGTSRPLVDLAAKHRLPAVYQFREFVDAGGLMAYGPDLADLFRRAATYVDKILKGAKPADLPVEQPTRFELVINLKTAKALGLTIPPSLLARADQVIDP